ncbi:hypothetical protein [Acinetobacter nematophilus]|uniref:Uncharacterized protein n=1 Tax=Acinetobacter nematophilus TaxID=2994642 RepID=A0A9X3DWQ0_9GAMM|nr:hypothetical protein [Acinetobacter nematophilus]MCX5466514.1 hypothetical protein [Acinetobacter nematophilus]
MKKTNNSKTDSLTVFLFAIAIFLSFGWYFAEAENEVLREEQAAQNYTQHLHHEDK